MNPLHDAIARRAYEIWESEGRPHGRDVIHWVRAMWQVDPFPEYPDDDIVPHVPEIAAAIAEDEAWRARMDAARQEDLDAMQGEPAGFFKTTHFHDLEPEAQKAGVIRRLDFYPTARGETRTFQYKRTLENLDANRAFAGARGDDAMAETIDRQIESLSGALDRQRQALPHAAPAEPMTPAEFITVRQALGMPRADAYEEVCRLWNETDPEAHRAMFDRLWPAPPEVPGEITMKLCVDGLHASACGRDTARRAFARQFHIFLRTETAATFDRLWRNATKRKSKKSRKAGPAA